MGIRKMRPLGSVRSINRPRQTWAMKAGQATKNGDGNIVPVTYRLNYVNGGSPVGSLSARHHSVTTSSLRAPERGMSELPSYVT